MSWFESVIGYEDIKAELIRISDVLNKPKKYEKLNAYVPHGILLYGDHGMGKTMMAECFINECKCLAFGINKEEPDCDMINEIRMAFADAKKIANYAIVFLDNLDDAADANVYATLKACMDDCRGLGVFVLAIAKDKDHIPDYLLRSGRFDKVIELDNPTFEDAKLILERYLSRKKCAADVDAREIAGIMRGHSYADLVMVVNEAAIYAGSSDRDTITQEDLVRACLSLIFASPEKVGAGKEREMLEVAVHESGHVVAAEVLKVGCVSVTSISRHTGGACGVTCVNEDRKSGRHIKLIEDHIIRGLAGKAASEIVLDIIDTGCADDLERAFRQVERLVDNFCAYGFDTYEFPHSSEMLRAKKEQRIAEKMEEYYQETKKLLTENRAFLDNVTEGLMRNKTLRQKDIKRIRDELVVK